MGFSTVIATFRFLKLMIVSFHFSDIPIDYQAFAVKGGAFIGCLCHRMLSRRYISTSFAI